MTLFLICFFTHSSHIIAYCEHICIYSISAAIYWLFNIVQVGKVPQVQRRPASGSTVVSLSRRSEWKSERNGAKKKKGEWEMGVGGREENGKNRGQRWGERWKGQNTVFISCYKIFIEPLQKPNWASQRFEKNITGNERKKRREKRREREREKRRESTGLGATLRHHPIGLSHLY